MDWRETRDCPEPGGYTGQVGTSIPRVSLVANQPFRELMTWTGKQSAPSSVLVHIAPALDTSAAQKSALRDANTIARLSWSVGQAQYSALMDLRGPTALALTASTIRVEVSTDGAVSDTAVQASIVANVSARAAGTQPRLSFVETVPASGAGDVTIEIPDWAESLQLYAATSGAFINFLVNINDGKGNTIGSWEQPSTQAGVTVPLARGAMNAVITQSGGVARDVVAVFLLGL